MLVTMLVKRGTMLWWWLWSVVVVCCVLLGCAPLLGAADTGSVDTCLDRQFSGRDRVELCHNASKVGDRPDMDCGDEGFVLTRLVLAPMSFFEDCDQHFIIENLYDARCQGNLTQRQDEYDRIIFDLLGMVSGQSRIPSRTVVDRFPMSVVKDGTKTEDKSALVMFKKKCKPADPEHNGYMINMCSNQTLNYSLMTFTLRGMSPPPSPSMCRCVLRPSTNLELFALDVRLQSNSTQRCGRSTLKIEANETTKEIRCHKRSALYGSEVLYSSNSPQEVTLTLTYITEEEAPLSVWIEAKDTYNFRQQMSVSCGGFIPIVTEPPEEEDSDDDDNDDSEDGDVGGDDDDDNDAEEKPEAADAGADFIVILACVLGAILVMIVLAVIIVRRRRSGSYGGVLPSCGQCCQRKDDDGDSIFYKAVAQEPVYAEPGKPRPSTTTPPYTFPVDAKFPDGQAVYAEPDPNGTLSLAARAATPPPVPDVPPPGSPPMFPPGTPPPKPERTLLRQRKESTRSNPQEEDYDHIVAGGKSPLKSPGGRDGQNNIIGDREEEGIGELESNIYDCLRHRDDYSQIGEFLKPSVKDNDYDTTA